MAYLTVIDNYIIGDAYVVSRTVDRSNSTLLSLTDAWFTVKDDLSTMDSSAKIFKHITETFIPGSGVITNDSITSDIFFELTPENGNLLLADTRYIYDIQVRDEDDIVKTVEYGHFIPKGSITNAIQ